MVGVKYAIAMMVAFKVTVMDVAIPPLLTKTLVPNLLVRSADESVLVAQQGGL
jgi:hypothetical protein